MLNALMYVGAGWLVGVATVLLYIRGRLTERWYVTGRSDEEDNGYHVLLKKGDQEIVCFRVKFNRPSSPNPDTSFADQVAQARAEAYERAAALNGHEHLIREDNRKHGTPGGLI
jgi:hypothetical protein